MASDTGFSKTAACLCGALTVTVDAPPRRVHACTCLDCQRMSGGTMSYTAFFPSPAVSVSGPATAWRRMADSGRWTQSHFCPACGSRVFTIMEAFPEFTGVAVGCFADPSFEKPAALFWSARRHGWLPETEGIAKVEKQ